MNRKEDVKLFRLVQQQAGVSRRKARELIEAGEVDVDGTTLRDPFAPINLETTSELRLRGHPLSTIPPQHRIYKYHKPVGVLCTHDDPHYGHTVGRRLRAEGFIGYTWAGRLDQDAEGLILLTNDGHLVHWLTHPRYQVEKVYRVWLSNFPKQGELQHILSEMRRGIDDSGETLKISAGEVSGSPPRVILTLTEGKKNEIKRLFSHFSLEVTRLKRVMIGPIRLDELPVDAIARLDAARAKELYSWLEQISQKVR